MFGYLSIYILAVFDYHPCTILVNYPFLHRDWRLLYHFGSS